MRFFFDNTMSPALARAVAALESASDRNDVVHLRTKFAANTNDVAWIRALGQERDWVIVSGDLHIMRNPAERAAWRESGLTAFFLKNAWADQKLWLYAARFVGWWPHIVTQAKIITKGKGFLVPFKSTRFEDVPQ
ncbi:MAG: hypothetical protein HY294_10095 [Candidatus Rokubacteria bacterium]|nr:hypothetical protein [Candidatus Rokubacteria bacterium]